MKHSNLKVGMKVKRVSHFNDDFFASTEGNISTVEYIDNNDFTFSVNECKQCRFDARLFEPVIEEQVEEKPMNKISMGKKYKTRSGLPVRVLCIDVDDELYPVVAIIKNKFGEASYQFTSSGGLYVEVDSEYDLIGTSPYEDFKKDDKVMVSAIGDRWTKRYFAYEKDGKAYCYADGGDSWATTAVVPWNFCRKPTQEELSN